MEVLAKKDFEELKRHEETISRGLDTFVEVGAALLAIRDGRLYRVEYKTFEDYCKNKWGISRIHAHRMIEASSVVNNLLPMGNILPETERQVRPLVSLPFEKQAEVWKKAVETAPDGKITAAHVQKVVNEDKGLKTCDVDPRHIWMADIEQCPYCTKTSEERIQFMQEERRIEKPHVAHNSGENEWYTPAEYIDAAYTVMGGIDLDPASSAIANKTVNAKKFYTKQDDGLNKEWKRGRVWMNPPYSSDLIGAFVDKYVEFISQGGSEGIVLVNNATETGWFVRLISVSSAVAFPSSRIKFIDPSGKPSGAPLQGQAIIYAGGNVNLFIETFGKFGWVAKL